MRLSKIYLGETRDHEHRLRALVGVDLGRLHVIAQRVSWGILTGERAGVDLDAEVDRALAEFGDQFAAHVTAAFVRTLQARPDAARKHLAQARSLFSPEHPFASILPESTMLPERPRPVLEEVEAGRVYRVRAHNQSKQNPFGSIGVATFVRLCSGELVCINPVDMSELAEPLRALGDVTTIIAPAKYHNDHVPQAQKLFPGARTFGVPGHRGYPQIAHIRFDGYLDDDAPLFPGELDQITMRGVDVGDVWLIDRASGTLLVTDAVFFIKKTPGDAAYRTPFIEFYTWAWGISGRVGLPSYQPVMWRDVRAYQASIRRALERDFTHAGWCHGAWHEVEGVAKSSCASHSAGCSASAGSTPSATPAISSAATRAYSCASCASNSLCERSRSSIVEGRRADINGGLDDTCWGVRSCRPKRGRHETASCDAIGDSLRGRDS